MVDLQEIADQRSDSHIGHQSQRILGKDHDLVGVSGETIFAKYFGLKINDEIKPEGDDGVDFLLGLNFTVDVKTARKPYNLLLEVGKPVADIYVLADYNDGDPYLLGWEWGKNLENAPTRDFGYGVINHYIPAEELRSLDELLNRSIWGEE
tara:strand:+ start:204 stop:656 length:453 start_codon:yes stop_codon:yes gene_type:complete